jgi:hypothetical protein
MPPLYERSPSMLLKGPRQLKEEVRAESPDLLSPSQSTPALFTGTAKMRPVLKLLVSKAGLDERDHVKEVAEVLEDILHSVELRMKRIVGRKQDRNAIINKALENRQAQMKAAIREKREEEKKRLDHMAELQDILAKKRAEKEE